MSPDEYFFSPAFSKINSPGGLKKPTGEDSVFNLQQRPNQIFTPDKIGASWVDKKSQLVKCSVVNFRGKDFDHPFTWGLSLDDFRQLIQQDFHPMTFRHQMNKLQQPSKYSPGGQKSQPVKS